MDKDKKIIPIIMSGGNGTRLWPLSKINKPKQFIKLINNETLFTYTLRRFSDYNIFSQKLIVVTNSKYINFVKDEIQYNNLNSNNILNIVEPESRNTAPAIASVVNLLYKQNKSEDIILITPSDSFIENNELFNRYIEEGKRLIEQNNGILLFGVKPLYPETGYGYIQFEENSNNLNNYNFEENSNNLNSYNNIHQVIKFVEKPPLNVAIEYIKSNNYLWNTGMLMAKVSTLYELFEEYGGKMLSNANSAIEYGELINNCLFLNEDCFSRCPNISIDYAIIEKINKLKLKVILMSLNWSDIGAYNTLYDVNSKQYRPSLNNINSSTNINNLNSADNVNNINNNTTSTTSTSNTTSTTSTNNSNNVINYNNHLEEEGKQNKIILNNVNNCYFNIKKSIVVCSDIKNLVVVEENNVILILDKNHSQNLKKVIEKIKENKLEYIL